MGYYDNVKDSIRDENGEEKKKESSKDDESSSGGMGNFDTLREAAEETEVKDEDEGDGTPIEVLEEDGIKQETPSKSQKQRQKKATTESRSKNTAQKRESSRKVQKNPEPSTSEVNEISGDTSELEDKLDKIIEQNAQMIEILESFGN